MVSPLWTASEDKQLKEMVAAGKSNLQIAVALNRSKSGVGNRKRRLGLVDTKPGPVPAADKGEQRNGRHRPISLAGGSTYTPTR